MQPLTVDAVGQRVRHGVGAREGRQQRWVRVEDSTSEPLQHRRTDDPHVAGEHDRVGRQSAEGGGQRLVVAARDQRGLDPLFHRPVERGTGTIGEHEHDLAAELATVGRCRQRPQVRAAAGDPDGDPAGHARPSSGAST